MRNRQRRNPMKRLMSPDDRVVRDRYFMLEVIKGCEKQFGEILEYFPVSDGERRAVKAAQTCMLRVMEGYEERTKELKEVVSARDNQQGGDT